MSYYRREFSPEPEFKPYHEESTAEKFSVLQEIQKEYEELLQENLWLKEQMQRKNSGQVCERKAVYQHAGKKRTEIALESQQNDIVLWNMIERNRYLEIKLEKLRKQQEKQVKAIKKIEKSEEWKERLKCGPEKCYHKKYMQLLRVRSPFF